MQINLDSASLQALLSGRKFYLGALAGMAALAANHYGVLPFPINNDPAAWLNDEYGLVMAIFARAGVAKIGGPIDPRLSQIIATLQKRPDDKPV